MTTKRGIAPLTTLREQTPLAASPVVDEPPISLAPSPPHPQRYRICPHHMGLHSIVLNGSTSRFCQQCGRFQPVEDFDDDKKTCRRKVRTGAVQTPRASRARAA